MAQGGNRGARPARSEYQTWLDDIAAYERAFKQWEGRVEKILKRYRDDPRTGRTTFTSAKFNILWSNVQTLSAATFATLPKPDVSRSFRDSDPVGRVASLLLERALDYHVQHYPEYRMALRADVLDRFLGARGTSWVRYEPHFRAAPPLPADGDQITDDVENPADELDYECVAVDYVHYRDFGHSVARTWEEVNRVWRVVYMDRDALIERFGDAGKTVPLDADPKKVSASQQMKGEDADDRAAVYEGWDKAKRRAVWFSKAQKGFLDEKDDPLGLDDVFPCPRPLYGTLTNDSLVPVPDFIIYQDQANELDLLADRIDGLVKALKVCGGYDASVPELARIFTESENGTLIPIKNWAAFAEKNGLQGALSLVDLKPIADALKHAYEAFFQIKNQVDELIGISDIMRGETEASETATAQQLKSQYGNLKLKNYQKDVSQYATDLFKIMAQVICKKFTPQTIATISGAEQLMPQDQQLLPAAMALLVGPERMQDPESETTGNPVRDFRIEVAADSLIYLDEEQEKKSRVEFLGAVGAFLKQTTEAVAAMPQPVSAVMVPLLMDMLKFGVQGYRVGKSIEGAFDVATEKLKQLAAQPQQPQEPPEVQTEKIRAQVQAQAEQAKDAREREGAERDMILAREKMAGEMTLQREKQEGERQLAYEKMRGEQDLESQRIGMEERRSERELGQKKEAADADREVDERLQGQKIEASAKPTANVQVDAEGSFKEIAEALKQMAELMAKSAEANNQAMVKALSAVAQAASADRIVKKRDKDGRVLQTGTVMPPGHA